MSDAAIRRAVIAVRDVLARHIYIARDEGQLQRQIVKALIVDMGLAERVGRIVSVLPEQRATGGRIDIVVTYETPLGERVALGLELKVKGQVAAVERQAMRYARGALDAVGVVTTDERLARGLLAGHDWTGKSSQITTFGRVPYFVVRLRSF